MKILRDLDGNLIPKPVKCVNCGLERGRHKANTFNCPAIKSKFPYFHEDKFYTPKEKK
jgi:predicted Zn-ribbon and HTH transcriptional regulator